MAMNKSLPIIRTISRHLHSVHDSNPLHSLSLIPRRSLSNERYYDDWHSMNMATPSLSFDAGYPSGDQMLSTLLHFVHSHGLREGIDFKV